MNVPDRGNAHDVLVSLRAKYRFLATTKIAETTAQEFFRSSTTCLRTRLRKFSLLLTVAKLRL
jgi:hypothetical protein